MKLSRAIAVVLLVCSAVTGQACAGLFTLGFGCISDDDPTTAAIVAQQLTVDVVPVDITHVKFVFGNAGPYQVTLTEVYFDGAVLQGVVSMLGPDGVSFVEGAKPSNLPGGRSLTPAFLADFSAQAVSPGPKNGVNPYEYLDVVCMMSPGKTFGDIIGSLAAGDLRIGIRASDIAYQNTMPDDGYAGVPEPATIGIFGLGSLCLRRPRKRT